MKRTQLVILVLLVLVLGGAAYLLLKRSTTSWQSSAGSMRGKIVDLPMNQVAQIIIQQPEGKLDLTRKGDTWVVEERKNYPANLEMISTLLRQVWELKPVQEVKVGESQLGRLSLLAPGQGTSSGTLVEFKDASGKRLTALLVGKQYKRDSDSAVAQGRSFPAGRYVMPEDGSRRVSLVSETFQQLEGKPERWLERDFIKIEKPISFTIAAAEPTMNWKLEREQASKEWKLADLKGDERTDVAKANQVTSAIGNITSFSDVLVDSKPETTGLDKPVTFTVRAEDGFNYVLNVGKKMDDKYPLTVAVTAEIPATRVANKDEKPEDKEKLDKEFQTKRETLEKKLAKEKKLEGWIFVIPKFGIEQAEKNRADLLAPKTTPTPTPSPSAARPKP